MADLVPGKLVILLLVLAGLVVLQIFLSKKEEKLLGLMLPIINFIYSLLVAYRSMRIYEEHKMYYEESYLRESIGSTLVLFILVNIPTVIFLITYLICRKNFNRNKELEKMNIQDLD